MRAITIYVNQDEYDRLAKMAASLLLPVEELLRIVAVESLSLDDDGLHADCLSIEVPDVKEAGDLYGQ